jgi:hypothetical protein
MTSPINEYKRIPGLEVHIDSGIYGRCTVTAEIFNKQILTITAGSKEDITVLFEQLATVVRITAISQEKKRTFEATYMDPMPRGVGATPYNPVAVPAVVEFPLNQKANLDWYPSQGRITSLPEEPKK